jgi:hypothetical protein
MTLANWLFEALPDGLPHTPDGEKIESLLDGSPIIFANQNRAGASALNPNGLARSRRSLD